MKLGTILSALTLAGAFTLGTVGAARAHEKFQNLKVLEDNGKQLEAGMKALSKGLGVKCNACHEKGKFESDSVATKGDARTFLTAVVGEADQAKKDAALKVMLTALKLEAAKEPAEVWNGVGMLAKKK